jgi:hypothetical protein
LPILLSYISTLSLWKIALPLRCEMWSGGRWLLC